MSFKPAWRGVVFKGEVWAWPMVMWDHNAAFNAFPGSRDYTCRWRQWNPGGPVDFDEGASDKDKALVEAWLAKVSA